ncbi:MAG: PLP-dependent aminotransferase family protein [Cytophagales bacterium]|nr:PLP-dependent aminotransferase family protein [Cytophagales bacterium]
MTLSSTFAKRLGNVETSAIRELFKLLAKPGIISFAGGFPDSSMFDVAGIKAATDQALGASAGAVLQYGATEGYNPLRAELSKHMASKGVTVSPDGLIITTGSQQALDLIGKTMIDEGDKVIVEAPTFLATIQCFRLYGANVIGAPIDADGVQVDKLEQLIIQHQPKLVYLIPSFGNPSGALLTQERRKRILALAVQYKVLVVEDDPYGELYFDESPSAAAPRSMLSLTDEVAGSRDWLAFAGSFSKVMSPGLRVGWLIAPPELLAKATMCKQFSDAHTSNLSQAIAANYLAAGAMPSSVAKVRRVYAARARTMAECLTAELGDAIRFTAPQGGMFFWANLTGARGQSTDVAALAKAAIDNHVAFVPGAPFFAHDADMTALRLSFATANEDLIREGVARLGRAFRSL